MKADPEAQRRLLDLQAIDTSLAQLAHRRRTLPEHRRAGRGLRGSSPRSTTSGSAPRSPSTTSTATSPGSRRTSTRCGARADRDRGRLDDGTGPARELEALQHELATLNRRQTELEDAELELMEQREKAQGELDGIAAAARRGARDERAAAEQRRDEAVRRHRQGAGVEAGRPRRRSSPTCRPT